MKVGLGRMLIRPDDFWGYTISEWLAACAGYVEANSNPKDKPFHKSDLKRLMEKYPDGNRNAP